MPFAINGMGGHLYNRKSSNGVLETGRVGLSQANSLWDDSGYATKAVENAVVTIASSQEPTRKSEIRNFDSRLR